MERLEIIGIAFYQFTISSAACRGRPFGARRARFAVSADRRRSACETQFQVWDPRRAYNRRAPTQEEISWRRFVQPLKRQADRRDTGRGQRAPVGARPFPLADSHICEASGQSPRPSPCLSPRAGRGARGAALPLSPPCGERQGEGPGGLAAGSQCPQNQPSGRFGRPAAVTPRPSPGLSPRARERSPRRRSSPLPPFAGRGRVRGLGIGRGPRNAHKISRAADLAGLRLSLRPSPDLSPLGGERSPRRRSSPLPALRGERQGEGRGDWPQASHYPQYQRSGRFGRPARLSAPHPTSPRWAGRGARGAGLPLSPPFAGRGRVRGLGDWPQASHYPQYQRSGRFGRPAASRPAPLTRPLPAHAGRGARRRLSSPRSPAPATGARDAPRVCAIGRARSGRWVDELD